MPVTPLGPAVPFYFGKEGRKLFGCFHYPAQESVRTRAVLICQPLAHEYVNSHRALRQLAVRLAMAGFLVLRFDYYGCGDSYGEPEQGSITRWLEDISTAINELRAQAAASKVCVVGLRLGATLAALSGSRREAFESLVLWEPVVSGKSYLRDLTALHEEMQRFRPKPRRSIDPQVYVEVLGFPLSRHLYSQLEELDLGKIQEKPAAKILILQNAQAGAAPDLTNHLVQTRAQVDRQIMEAPEIWLPSPDGSLLVPAPVLQSVVSWMCSASS